jgi:hypothetical protein
MNQAFHKWLRLSFHLIKDERLFLEFKIKVKFENVQVVEEELKKKSYFVFGGKSSDVDLTI